MIEKRVIVQADWDPEAEVYVATSSDVPGLVAHGATAEELAEALKILIPELLELNSHQLDPETVFDRHVFVVQLKKESLVYA